MGRPRPNHTDLEDVFNFKYLTMESNFHSFPSGHSSTIFIVCFILVSVLPKLKYFFYFLASIVAFSRVIVSAHFFTDIVAGAILALILFKVLKQKGILNIGGRSQNIYDFVVKENKNIKKIFLNKNSNYGIPKNSSLNLLKLKKILKKNS